MTNPTNAEQLVRLRIILSQQRQKAHEPDADAVEIALDTIRRISGWRDHIAVGKMVRPASLSARAVKVTQGNNDG